MKMGIKCFSCMVTQVEKIISILDLDYESGINIMREVFSFMSEMDLSSPTPVIARQVYTLMDELTGCEDPFAAVKKMSNDNAAHLVPEIRKMMDTGSGRLADALRVSISGNIIDYGAPGSGEMVNIRGSLDEAMSSPVDGDTLNSFSRDTENAERILFIGDNAGEIVFDMVLLEELPASKITYVVRGGPIINDATMHDVAYTGLDRSVRVIDTGDRTPGIDFSGSSDEFMQEMERADMVILKGQGNLETVYDQDLRPFMKQGVPLYFLIKVKCDYIAEMIERNIGDIAFLRRLSWQ